MVSDSPVSEQLDRALYGSRDMIDSTLETRRRFVASVVHLLRSLKRSSFLHKTISPNFSQRDGSFPSKHRDFGRGNREI